MLIHLPIKSMIFLKNDTFFLTTKLITKMGGTRISVECMYVWTRMAFEKLKLRWRLILECAVPRATSTMGRGENNKDEANVPNCTVTYTKNTIYFPKPANISQFGIDIANMQGRMTQLSNRCLICGFSDGFKLLEKKLMPPWNFQFF